MSERSLFLPLVQVSTALLVWYTSPVSTQAYQYRYQYTYPQMNQVTNRFTTYTSSSGQSNANVLPAFEFINPRGLRMTVPGPYPASSVYTLKFHVNINHNFQSGVKIGDWNGDASVPRGSSWSYTFPEMRLGQGDTIYYLVEVRGVDGLRSWYRDYTGYYQVPYPNPHGTNSGYVEVRTPPVAPPPPPAPVTPVPNNVRPPVYYQQTTPVAPVNNNVRPPVYYPAAPLSQPNPAPVTQAPNNVRPPVYYPQTAPVAPPTANNVKPPVYYPQRKPPITNINPTRLTPSTNNNIPDKTIVSRTCRTSTTTYNNGRRGCAGQALVNNIEFNTVQQIAGHDPEETFTVFSKENVVRNRVSGSSIDSVWPILLEEKYGADFVDQSLSLSECTSRDRDHCSFTAMNYFILPPVISGRETTENTLSFRFGVLEVTAKLPSGDWIVPELWLMPKGRVYGNSSGKVVLAMARGNKQLSDGSQDYSGRVLEAGVQMGSDQRMFRKQLNRPWSDEYHKYKLIWTPDKMEFFVDNQIIGQVYPGQNGLDSTLRGTKIAPFDQEFYLVFGVHVGGDNDFPDSLIDKPWKNGEPKNKVNFWRARKKWHPTWKTDESALHIAGITLTALDT